MFSTYVSAVLYAQQNCSLNSETLLILLINPVFDLFLLNVSLNFSRQEECPEVGKHNIKMKGENWEGNF